MPKVWKDTIEEHRQAVREATIDTVAALVVKRGFRSVTMSKIAEETGIGRATLYKYFSDVESILLAWHQREIERHLRQLEAAAAGAKTVMEKLTAVLEAYALSVQETRSHHGSELATLLHRDPAVHEAEHRLHHLIGGLIRDASAEGELRDDVPPRDLATYCIHALQAARGATSKVAARRFVRLTLEGIQR